MTRKQKALVLVLVLVVAAALLACTAGSACYSTFEGCEPTAQAIATAAALPRW